MIFPPKLSFIEFVFRSVNQSSIFGVNARVGVKRRGKNPVSTLTRKFIFFWINSLTTKLKG